MLKHFALAVAFTLTAASASYAQSAQPESVRDEGDRLCRPDASRFCGHVVSQGDFVVLACLQQNAQRLRRGCREFLQRQGQL